MASPYPTNMVSKTVAATTDPAKKRELNNAKDYQVDKKVEGDTTTIHASDAEWLEKRGLVS